MQGGDSEENQWKSYILGCLCAVCVSGAERESEQGGGDKARSAARQRENTLIRKQQQSPRPWGTPVLGNQVNGEQEENCKKKWNPTGMSCIRLTLIELPWFYLRLPGTAGTCSCNCAGSRRRILRLPMLPQSKNHILFLKSQYRFWSVGCQFTSQAFFFFPFSSSSFFFLTTSSRASDYLCVWARIWPLLWDERSTACTASCAPLASYARHGLSCILREETGHHGLKMQLTLEFTESASWRTA